VRGNAVMHKNLFFSFYHLIKKQLDIEKFTTEQQDKLLTFIKKNSKIYINYNYSL